MYQHSSFKEYIEYYISFVKKSTDEDNFIILAHYFKQYANKLIKSHIEIALSFSNMTVLVIIYVSELLDRSGVCGGIKQGSFNW